MPPKKRSTKCPPPPPQHGEQQERSPRLRVVATTAAAPTNTHAGLFSSMFSRVGSAVTGVFRSVFVGDDPTPGAPESSVAATLGGSTAAARNNARTATLARGAAVSSRSAVRRDAPVEQDEGARLVSRPLFVDEDDVDDAQPSAIQADKVCDDVNDDSRMSYDFLNESSQLTAPPPPPRTTAATVNAGEVEQQKHAKAETAAAACDGEDEIAAVEQCRRELMAVTAAATKKAPLRIRDSSARSKLCGPSLSRTFLCAEGDSTEYSESSGSDDDEAHSAQTPAVAKRAQHDDENDGDDDEDASSSSDDDDERQQRSLSKAEQRAQRIARSLAGGRIPLSLCCPAPTAAAAAAKPRGKKKPAVAAESRSNGNKILGADQLTEYVLRRVTRNVSSILSHHDKVLLDASPGQLGLAASATMIAAQDARLASFFDAANADTANAQHFFSSSSGGDDDDDDGDSGCPRKSRASAAPRGKALRRQRTRDEKHLATASAALVGALNGPSTGAFSLSRTLAAGGGVASSGEAACTAAAVSGGGVAAAVPTSAAASTWYGIGAQHKAAQDKTWDQTARRLSLQTMHQFRQRPVAGAAQQLPHHAGSGAGGVVLLAGGDDPLGGMLGLKRRSTSSVSSLVAAGSLLLDSGDDGDGSL